MAPTLKNANLKGLEQIAFEVEDIAGRARENKLKPEELSGGTFTVSNLENVILRRENGSLINAYAAKREFHERRNDDVGICFLTER
jgi:pyruvate/2-oxoglutarate dehydrogenase complex dihydrolipoamide acyltransferase (E2) component